MINCPWSCMASYNFRSSSDSSTSWMTTVRGGSLTSGLPSSSSHFSRLMEICLRSFCKRLWAKEKNYLIWVSTYLALLLETGSPHYVVIRAKRRSTVCRAKAVPLFLSYFNTLSNVTPRESSPRPPAPQSSALPVELLLLWVKEQSSKAKENYAYLGKKGKKNTRSWYKFPCKLSCPTTQL